MNIPENLKYTKDHEWVKVDGNQAIIGITEYAQGELGDIVFVDIDPEISEIVSGESFGTIEAVKTVSDLFAPCNGKVIEVNSSLEDQPELINTDSYGEGWIIKVELSDPSELDGLLDSVSYQAQITV
jgi:glycine cleavage system H protein